MHNIMMLLSVAALAGGSLAQNSTSTSMDPTCAALLSDIGRNAPTPAPALGSYLATALAQPLTAPGQTTALPDNSLADPAGYQELFCSLARELPKSLLPDFKSHGAALLSYGSAHVSEYDAYITNCITTGEAASTLISELNEMFTGTGAVCKTTASVTGSSNGTYPTGTGSIPNLTPTASVPTSTALVPTAAATRHTGAFISAAAIAGLLGAVAVL
ncbi:hypothetical protein F4861DRAFT_440624 [Xylaria intraflava]|nr:hypothetical protein F4861DRAFT_440624 [Xylaria intraflava]